MPSPSHKSEYTILLVLAVLSGLVLLAMSWSGMTRQDRSGRPDLRTTRSTNVDGMLACYELFKRLEIPVERSNRMLLSANLEGAGVVFVIDPQMPMNTGEIVNLGAWIERGGVLVASRDMGFVTEIDPAAADLMREERSSRADPSGPRILPLSRDVREASLDAGDTFALKLPDERTPRKAMEPLFEDSYGVRIAEHRMGRGRLILLSDSSFLDNEHLGVHDNSVLAVNLVSYAMSCSTTRKVLFDEYHFGFGDGNQGFRLLGDLLLTTSPGWSVLALTAAGILFLVYRGRQFGPRRDMGRQRRRRSKMEFVHAVGATYRSAGAHRLTLKLIYSWFRQRAAGRTGVAPTASNGLLAQELGRRGRMAAGEIQRTLDDCDGLLARPAVSQRQLTAAISRLAQIEKEALDGLGNGK
ncbi:MAG: DUF4350 domain-containing protein [Phycisphaerales bacterium]